MEKKFRRFTKIDYQKFSKLKENEELHSYCIQDIIFEDKTQRKKYERYRSWLKNNNFDRNYSEMDEREWSKKKKKNRKENSRSRGGKEEEGEGVRVKVQG